MFWGASGGNEILEVRGTVANCCKYLLTICGVGAAETDPQFVNMFT